MTESTELNPAPFTGTARFALVRELGSGGMGIVFEVEDRVRSSRVALKTLQRLNPTDLYRFKKEFRSLQSLVHPNLVTLYEFISEQGQWFFTMELVEGADLLAYVRGVGDRGAESADFTIPDRPDDQTETAVLDEVESLGPGDLGDSIIEENTSTAPGAPQPPRAEPHEPRPNADPDSPSAVRIEVEGSKGPACDLPRLRSVLEQIAAGLHFLHESGMLHRDLKPPNVLVTPAGRVAILDFGLIAEVEGRFPLANWDAESVPGATFSALSMARALAQTDRGLVGCLATCA